MIDRAMELGDRARQRVAARLLATVPPTPDGMGIPAARLDGRLPVGIYEARMDEFLARFGGEPFSLRTANLDALAEMAERLRSLGVRQYLVGGSTVIYPDLAPTPHNINVAWERTPGVRARDVRHAIREEDALRGVESMNFDGRRPELLRRGDNVRGLVDISEAGKVGTKHGGSRELVTNIELLARAGGDAGDASGLVRLFADDIIRTLR